MYRSLIFFTTLTLSSLGTAQGCTMIMGYRTTDRLPYIEAAPDNSGLYLDLYTEASRRIGCQLKVIREPKNRIMESVKSGRIDFYPGLIFSPERAKDFFFAPNGLPSQQVALTRSGLPLMNSLQSMRGKTLIMAMGGAYKHAIQYGINVRTPPELEVEKGIEFIEEGKGDVYVDELSTLSFYLNNYAKKDKLMLHPNCCGGASHFTMGLSRKSKNARYIPNPKFDPFNEISIGNDPIKLAPDSLLGRFSQAVLQLGKDGFTEKLYKQYYGIEMPKVPEGN
ncbi:ABC transporter substrate-binding protein [Chitinibacter sp. GC72]|uniref:substrate-binding periplasmic protein n=1 Tax=Chitinibacter sp. GC72 TaxID=1526917 RepID=UPI0012F781FF|nr:transporter substrate-binding domain-containing protein [Chitinibacter sp. GC72]